MSFSELKSSTDIMSEFLNFQELITTLWSLLCLCPRQNLQNYRTNKVSLLLTHPVSLSCFHLKLPNAITNHILCVRPPVCEWYKHDMVACVIAQEHNPESTISHSRSSFTSASSVIYLYNCFFVCWRKERTFLVVSQNGSGDRCKCRLRLCTVNHLNTKAIKMKRNKNSIHVARTWTQCGLGDIQHD